MESRNSTRRTYLKRIQTATLGVAATLAGCGSGPQNETPTRSEAVGQEQTVATEPMTTEQTPTKTAQTTAKNNPTEIQFISRESNPSTPMYLYGRQHDVWEKYNISLSLNLVDPSDPGIARSEDVDDIINRRIQGSQAAGSSESEIGQLRTTLFIRQSNIDKDVGVDPPIRIVGRAGNWNVQLLSRVTDDSITDPTDLDNKLIGVIRPDFARVRILHKMILNSYNFDILNDTKDVIQDHPKSLANSLLEGKVDAIPGYFAWTASPDEVKTVFDTYSYWMDITGDPAPVIHYVAHRDWVRKNADTLLAFFQGSQSAYRLFDENTQEALQNYGSTTQGVTPSETQQEEWKKQIPTTSNGHTPLMNQEMIDNDYQFMEQLLDMGLVNQLPGKSEMFMNESQIREMAGGSS